MHCYQLDKCEFIEKIRGSMPNTAGFVESAYCANKGRCLKKELARTMIEHLEAEKGVEEK